MRPEKKSQLLLGVTRSKAKMLEYGIPAKHHIKITEDPAKLFTISIGLLGDLAAAINREEPDPDSLAELKSNLLFSSRFLGLRRIEWKAVIRARRHELHRVGPGGG